MSVHDTRKQENSRAEQVKSALRSASDPVLTATEVAERIGVSRQAAHGYLQTLADEGEINRKKAGAKAVVWWLPD